MLTLWYILIHFLLMADIVASNQPLADDLHSTKITMTKQKWSLWLALQVIWQLPTCC